jgi:hypothetical protein
MTSRDGGWRGNPTTAARLAADHPGRFWIFAAVPLPHMAASLAEIEYGLDALKARRHRAVHELSRQVAGRSGLRSGHGGAQPPPGRGVRASGGTTVPPRAVARRARARGRIRLRYDPRHHPHFVQRHGATSSRHPLDLLPRRRHHAVPGGAPGARARRQQVARPIRAGWGDRAATALHYASRRSLTRWRCRR